MRKILLAMMCVLTISSLSAQQTRVDPSPHGIKNVRAVMGGGTLVPIDTVTSLDALISRLNEDWEFVGTGKMYWIGYTDVMYSIASHQEAAIGPLMQFIRTKANQNGKAGAICTIHLIGIDSRIAGRYNEQFTNLKARIALRELLADAAFRFTVLNLLVRDPWQSDIPQLFAALSQPHEENWKLVNALTRYKVKDLPIHQRMPLDLVRVKVGIPAVQRLKRESESSSYERQLTTLLDTLQWTKPDSLIIEPALFQSKLYGVQCYDLTVLCDQHQVANKRGKVRFERDSWLFLGILLHEITTFDYLSRGCRIQYYTLGKRLYICSTDTARQRLLTWWEQQSHAFQNSFSENAASRP